MNRWHSSGWNNWFTTSSGSTSLLNPTKDFHIFLKLLCARQKKENIHVWGPMFLLRPSLHVLTACVESISLMEWSYCSARMASFLVCSSFSLLSTALWSDLGVVSSRWFLRALYCLVWVLQVSWNCFLIWSSLDWRRQKMFSKGV